MPKMQRFHFTWTYLRATIAPSLHELNLLQAVGDATKVQRSHTLSVHRRYLSHDIKSTPFTHYNDNIRATILVSLNSLQR